VEYQYIVNKEKLNWLQRELETTLQESLPLDQKKRILEKLNEGVKAVKQPLRPSMQY
jgi:2-oxoglutarate dehydrogenase E1 component